MADIELVIKISEETYNNLKIGCTQRISNDEMIEALKNGTPLPKGHGRLVDEKDLSLMTVHMIDEVFVCDAPTIIEADKEYEVEVITRGNCMMCGKELVEVDGLFFCKECENKVKGRK